MRRLFQFERKHEALATPAAFSSRLARNGMWALVLVVSSLIVGMAGYMLFEDMGLADAFANAAMILSGMGPLQPLMTPEGKIFAGLYAIVSGLLLFAIAGIILAPVYHRILHRFHVADDAETDGPGDTRKNARRKPTR